MHQEVTSPRIRFPFDAPPLTAPVPVSAVFDNSDVAAYVTFDQDLQVPLGGGGTWNNGTFTMHQASRWYETGVVSLSAPNVIKITAINAHIVAGSSVIDYTNALHTLVGVNGLFVASFTGFPCPAVP